MLGPNSPSHHDAEALDAGAVQRLDALLLLAPVGRFEARPGNVQVTGVATGDFKVVFVAGRGLLPAIVGIWRQQLVLEYQSVSLAFQDGVSLAPAQSR